MENLKEFRIVVNDVMLHKPDTSHAIDFDDYYLTRTDRIRYFPADTNKFSAGWYRIRSEPGMAVKTYDSIEPSDAERLVAGAELIVRKKGVGLVIIAGQEGYAERVIASRQGR